MIIHYGVCDHCSQQMEINEENKTMFQAKLQTMLLSRHEFNDIIFRDSMSFGGTKKAFSEVVTWVNNFNLAFCSKECFINYLTDRMKEDGTISLTEEEIKNLNEKFQDQNAKSTGQFLNRAQSVLEDMLSKGR